jgi:branched-chain amino acid transport system ATP-binding protein
LLPPSAGEIWLDGIPVSQLPAYKINRRGLSRSFQVTNIFPRLSVWENVRCAVLWAKGEKYAFWRSIDSNQEIAQRTEEVLSEINLMPRKDLPAGVLTYAEQRALEIGITNGRGCQRDPARRPTAGMSHAETERAVALIRRISEGRTLLIVEHDMSVVFGLADRISVLVYGESLPAAPPPKSAAMPKSRKPILARRRTDA